MGVVESNSLVQDEDVRQNILPRFQKSYLTISKFWLLVSRARLTTFIKLTDTWRELSGCCYLPHLSALL